jgi:hypothetical protein
MKSTNYGFPTLFRLRLAPIQRRPSSGPAPVSAGARNRQVREARPLARQRVGVGVERHQRFHDSIGNVAPEGMYHSHQRAILSHREKIKRLTLERRKEENLSNAA